MTTREAFALTLLLASRYTRENLNPDNYEENRERVLALDIVSKLGESLFLTNHELGGDHEFFNQG